MHTKRKHNGGYWTVKYVSENGEFINIGHAATKVEIIKQMILNRHKFPDGGKVVFTR